jgi:hypothetical protein
VEGLERAGRELTRESFLSAINSMTDFSLGPDVRLSFGPRDHQGMDTIYFTRLQKDRFTLLADWTQLTGGNRQKNKSTGEEK